jgi:thiol-disulfide isomerase/thioredoxin
MSSHSQKLPRRSIFAFLLCCSFLLLANTTLASSSAEEADNAAHTKIGDKTPPISVQKLSGDTFSSKANEGKILVVNFWATWCGPCQVEMPLLQKQIWEKYSSSPDFAMIAIAREQTQPVVAAFQKKHPQYTFPLAVDPKRSTYSLFADSGIPRTYLIDRHGKIIYQSLGYDPRNIPDLDQAIKSALASR